MDKLLEYVENNSDEYLLISQKRDIDGAMIDRVMDLVKKFIVSKNLILFGGMSIDYALRLKGDKIYPDDNRPDFDALSTNNIKDAYDLADILHTTGFETVSVVRGIHFQTMRVRTNSIFVADFGYIPPNIYDKIPTLNYKDFRITHPDFLRMDIHFVFSYPYKDFTMENIFHRWKKDIKRLNLLEKYYPIKYDGYFDILKSSHKLPFPIINNDNIAINGFAAYSLLLKFLESLDFSLDSLDSKDSKEDSKENSKDFKDFKEFKILDDSSLVFNSPIHSLDLITSIDVEDLLTNVQLKKYRPFLDVSHEIYKSNTEEYDVSITCNKTELTSVSKIYLSNYEISKEETDSYILIANPHNLLLWFLINAFKTQNNLYKQFYGYTMKLLKTAEEYYEKKSNIDTFMKSPFSPSTFNIGKYNFRPHYSINLAKAIERTKDKTDEKFPEILINMSGKNYNPSTSESHPLISYEHPLYKHNGEEFTY